MLWLGLLLQYSIAVPIQKGVISAPDVIVPMWKSCEDMHCISGFVCVLHSSPEYSGPLCVSAGTSTCLNVKCTAGFHCVHEEVDCEASPCYPQPKCVPTDGSIDNYGAPQPGPSPLGDPPKGNDEPLGVKPGLPPNGESPKSPEDPGNSKQPGNPGNQDENGNGNGNVVLTDFCSEINPCFIGFVCDTTGETPTCRKAKTCAETTCSSGMTCDLSPLNKDAECYFPGDCTLIGCSPKEICVSTNTKVPYCRLPLTCDDIICDIKNHCRPGAHLEDAVCVEQCPDNEHWDACGGCDGNCQDGQVACDSLCVPSNGACRCNSPLIRGPGGTCIELNVCPGRGPLPGTPGPPVLPETLYSKCQSLNCPCDEVCIDQALSVHCGKSDVKCSCSKDELCVVQIVQCFAPPCDPLPLCVSNSEINSCLGGPETVETTTAAVTDTTPANPTGTTPEITTPVTTETPPPMPTTTTDICALTDCATGLICSVNTDGTASCIPPVIIPPTTTQSPGYANPCDNHPCYAGLYCVTTNEGTPQCVIDEPVEYPHPPPLPPPPHPYISVDPCECFDCGPALFCVVNGDGKPQCVINKTSGGAYPSKPESDRSPPKCILPCAYPTICTITPTGPQCVKPVVEGDDSTNNGSEKHVEPPLPYI